MERFEDPKDPLNGPAYHTGKLCVQPGCRRPAGTNWSAFLCQPCNAERMARITRTLEHELARLEGLVPADSLPPDMTP